ncbi:tRNA-dihydrouridine synthase [Porticoccus sp. W117]|uniref:tRNA dihydrouridine synthase n=1 Tax=Porticoccus sp. W117 TaxID=3054777 RepID=UPI002598C138|nr:tRNA-dihydrouridine synthase [Porticoccus sp. W117]MDM3870319.1 tRNA-dihydrouridine synthase [Porticoccus sp. W117]
MRLFLAPMEGVVDHHMRDLLTGLGGVDICVTEFVRVTDAVLPERVFKKLCPELANGCQTPAGTPVRIQLLGSNLDKLARNGAKAARMGASAVDLNFGCPAKTVNSSDGGATLLKDPQRVYDVVKAVRDAVPQHVPVTAKIRLGFADRSAYLGNATAAWQGGASELAVHARSKADGYKPPAYWDYIGRIRQAVEIPVIANGEIWSLEDYQRCKQQTGCSDFMLGRGLLARPDLALQIKHFEAGTAYTPLPWGDVCQLLYGFYRETGAAYPEKFLGNRAKQWLMYLQRTYPQAKELFEEIKRFREHEDFQAAFDRQFDNSRDIEQIGDTII